MTTINLYQNQQDTQRNLSARTANGGFIFSIGILAVTLLAWGGLYVAVVMLNQQNTALTTNVDQEKKNLASFASLDNIVDLQNRLQQIKDNLQIKNSAVTRTQMTTVLDNIAAELNSSIVLSTYKYENDGNKVILTFNANNFNDASQQLLNFKKSTHFTNVALAGITRGEKAINCDVVMNTN